MMSQRASFGHAKSLLLNISFGRLANSLQKRDQSVDEEYHRDTVSQMPAKLAAKFLS